MAINPTGYPMPQSFIGEIDWGPLNRLGEQLKQQQQESEAAQLIANLYGRGDQGAGYTPQVTQGGGAFPTGGAPPVPYLNNPKAAPVPGMPAAAPTAPPAAPVEPPTGAPTMPSWMDSALAGNYSPAAPAPRLDPRTPLYRLLQRMGKVPSPATPFPADGTSPVPGLMPDNAVPTAPAPPWYNPDIARNLATFGSGAPPAPGAAQPPFPAPIPAAAPAAPAESPAPPAEAIPLPRERPVIPDVTLPPTQNAPGVPEVGAPPSRPGIENVMRVIRQKETGSSAGNYGNVTTTRRRDGTLQHALGAYGVMDRNVPQWTREVLGREMTPQEFLNNSAAQDAVARAKLTEYAQKYGTTGAARAWFAGESGMNNPRARDPLGTSVAAYASDFDRRMGLPPEITSGTSRPERDQRMALDATAAPAAPQASVQQRAIQNLASQQPASDAGISSEEIAALYKNPLTRPIATAFLQKKLDPGTYKFMAAGDNVIRYNERTGQYDLINSGKLHEVGDDKKLVDAKGNVIYSGSESDSARYGKLPANYRWKDPNNKALGVEAIPDSAATQLPSEVAAKIGLGKTFLNNLPSIKQRLDADMLGVDVNPTTHLAATLGGVGPGAEVKRQIESGADSLLRMLTGAGMGIQEAHDYAMRYRPTARDTKEQILSKMAQLEDEIHSTAEVIGRGHGGTPLGNMKRTFGSSGGATPAASALADVLGLNPATAPAASPGTALQLEVGKTYYGRTYKGGPPGNPNSWGARVQ